MRATERNRPRRHPMESLRPSPASACAPHRKRYAAALALAAGMLAWPTLAGTLTGTLQSQIQLTAGCVIAGSSGNASGVNFGLLDFGTRPSTFTGIVNATASGGESVSGPTQIVCSPDVLGISILVGPGSYAGQGAPSAPAAAPCATVARRPTFRMTCSATRRTAKPIRPERRSRGSRCQPMAWPMRCPSMARSTSQTPGAAGGHVHGYAADHADLLISGRRTTGRNHQETEAAGEWVCEERGSANEDLHLIV